ncbi:hypothetical protein LCL87_15975 [Rhodococcus hoagii]|nr:hypothetical protein [Prescottella equi]
MSVMVTAVWKDLMIRFPLRTVTVLSASAFAVAGIGLASATTASAVTIESGPTANYISFEDLAEGHFNVIDNLTDQINDALPGEEEWVFAVNKRGPRSVIGIWNPATRSQNTLMVECDPTVDTWDSYLRGSCSGNEESLLP